MPTRLNTLTTLYNYTFTALSLIPVSERYTSPIAAVLTELIVHVENVTDVHTTIWDTLLPFRRGSQVAKATNAVCKNILWQWIGAGNEKYVFYNNKKNIQNHLLIINNRENDTKIRDAIEEMRKEKKESWKTTAKTLGGYGYTEKKFDRHAAHNAYYFPTGLSNGGIIIN